MNKNDQSKVLLFTVFLYFLTLFGISKPAFALSPPWYLLQAKLQAALEADPCVQVQKLTGEGRNMEVAVKVCDFNKAQALATIISRKYVFNDKLIVSINVYLADQIILPSAHPTTTSEGLILLKNAFDGNQFFVKVDSKPNTTFGVVEFKPLVLQYFSDDISDWHRNTNLVASEAFKQILDLERWRSADFALVTTTSRIKSP